MAQARKQLTVLMVATSLVVAATAMAAGPVGGGEVSISTTGRPGAYTGFAVTVGRTRAASVLLQAVGRWKAREVRSFSDGSRKGLELRDIDTSGSGGTPELGPTSFVRMSLAPGEVYPRLDFRLDVRAFDTKKWEAAIGEKAPLHFLALPLATARVWYVHGLLCPTPRWDPYPMTRPTIHGLWAPGWSYGVALGALTVPAMALWDDQAKRMVGYEWAEQRFTDKTGKDLGIAYCNGVPGYGGQFLTLLSNYQQHWNELTYPKTPLVLQTHLRVIYSLDLPATADVGKLVMRHIFHDYHAILPQVPAMNDLSWEVHRRLDELGQYGPRGGGFLQTIDTKQWGFPSFFFDKGTVLYGGDFRNTDLMFKKGDAAAIARFNKDLAEFLSHVQWKTIDGDKCCFWRYPLVKGWNARMGGEAADTTHNVAQFGVGAAMLADYADTGRADLLPYIDGLFNYSKHYIYTRGDICDIPESMFTLQVTTLAMQFLMNYHYVFSKAPDEAHRRRAAEAFDLADTVVYRNSNVTLGDSDERDTVSGQFMMPGNYAKYWLGIVGPAELCMPFRSMIMMYTETGDPVFKWLVRGALDRWWIGFKEDCWHTAENIDIWGVSEGRKGAESGIHDPCDRFWEWAEPVGDSIMRVTVGSKGAIAFCKGTRALDVADFEYAPPKNFRFRVARIAKGAVKEPFAIIVSSPWRDLSGLAVKVDGKAVTGDNLRVLGTYHEHLYIRGVRVGSVVEIGDVAGAKAVKMASVPVATGLRGVPAAALKLGDRTFRLVDLGAQATVRTQRDWNSPDDWGGLATALAYADSVPYFPTGKAVGPGGKVAVHGREAFVLGVGAAPGSLMVETGRHTVDLAAGPKTLAAEGWPVCKWKLWLYPVALTDGRGELQVGKGGLVVCVTTLRSGPSLVEPLLKKIAVQEMAAKPKAESPIIAEAIRRLAGAAAKGKAVAFIPPCGETYSELASCAEKLGIEAHTLTPQDFVDEKVFSAARFPVAVYTGNENFYRTVEQKGDGEQALLRYLHEGGMLVVAGTCHPFTYPIDVQADGTEKQLNDWVLFNKQFELNLQGPGESTADAIGFEHPPTGVVLTMHLNPAQKVLWDFPKTMPFPTQGDVRYRPLSAVGIAPEDKFVPIVTTDGSDGKHYGPAAALIEHHCAAFRGAQVLWVWGSLLQGARNKDDALSAQLLTWAVTNAKPATEPVPAAMQMVLPPGGGERVAVLPPNCNNREGIIREACKTVGAKPFFLTPAQFVSHAYFNAKNFPIAIQAVGGESWICSYLAPGDGEQAYKQYLREGGTLIVCQPATPFWYELYYQGGKWKSRQPERFWSMAFDLGFETKVAFEKPKATMHLDLTAAGRKLWPDVTQGLALDYFGDQRWRPLTEYRSSAARKFTTLAYLTKPDGTRYPGAAAAEIDFLDSEYGGARVLYMWGNMVEGPVGEKMLAGCLRRAMSGPAKGAHRREGP